MDLKIHRPVHVRECVQKDPEWGSTTLTAIFDDYEEIEHMLFVKMSSRYHDALATATLLGARKKRFVKGNRNVDNSLFEKISIVDKLIAERDKAIQNIMKPYQEAALKDRRCSLKDTKSALKQDRLFSAMVPTMLHVNIPDIDGVPGILIHLLTQKDKPRFAKKEIYVHLVPEVVHYLRQVANVQMEKSESPQLHSRKRARSSSRDRVHPDAVADASDNEDEEVDDQLEEVDDQLEDTLVLAASEP